MTCKTNSKTAFLPQPFGNHLISIFGQQLWQTIQADNPAANRKVDWYTNKYEVAPVVLWKRWLDPSTLIGVRFDKTTTYALLDIDANSPYCNPDAIADIRSALETIGITRTILLRSSWSGGLHLYIPLSEAIGTFNFAVCLKVCLQAHGFAIEPGQLEIFPNQKTYGVQRVVLYNGHRLPLQPASGSCLLNDDLNPVGDSLEQLLSLWKTAAVGQDIELLKEATVHAREANKQAARRRPRSRALAEWQADMELEMTAGWSSPGQTNRLLKVIGCYGHVIRHLSGQALAQHIAETAQNLPGYQQHCGHQDKLHKRAKEWAISIQNLYWPTGTRPRARTTSTGTINQQRAADARDRITQAVKQLKQLTTVPSEISQWANRIAAAARCSLKTLYKEPYLPLWHPDYDDASTPMTAKRCVKGAISMGSATANPTASPTTESRSPCHCEVLHTTESNMKCVDERAAPKKIPPERGVRGDFSSFPQSLEASISPPIPFPEVHAAIQAKVQSLGWGLVVRQQIDDGQLKSGKMPLTFSHGQEIHRRFEC